MTGIVAAGTGFMRELNSATILRRLRTEASMSVSALAEAVGLSRQAVTRSLNALETEGLIEFVAPERGSARAGRPAQLVRFRAEAGHVLGLSLSPQDLRVCLGNLAGDVIGAEAVSLPPDLTGPEAVETLLETVDRVLDVATVGRHDIWYTSVGTPGIVDPAAGVIKLIPSMPGLAGDLLARRLTDALSGPVYLDNDVKLATQGERWHDAGRREETLVMIHWGERVGAGIVIGGELYRGASNDAGDIGFLDLVADSSVPVAGTTPVHGLGAFEEWVGAAAIVRLANSAAAHHGDHDLRDQLATAGSEAVDLVLDAAAAGAPAAVETIDVIASRFARGVAVIRALLDPRLIVIGGPMARGGAALIAAVRRHLDPYPLNQPALEVSALGDDAVAYGALHHSLEEIDRTRLDRLRTG